MPTSKLIKTVKSISQFSGTYKLIVKPLFYLMHRDRGWLFVTMNTQYLKLNPFTDQKKCIFVLSNVIHVLMKGLLIQFFHCKFDNKCFVTQFKFVASMTLIYSKWPPKVCNCIKFITKLSKYHKSYTYHNIMSLQQAV